MDFLHLDDGESLLAKDVEDALSFQDRVPPGGLRRFFKIFGHVEELFLLNVDHQEGARFFDFHVSTLVGLLLCVPLKSLGTLAPHWEIAQKEDARASRGNPRNANVSGVSDAGHTEDLTAKHFRLKPNGNANDFHSFQGLVLAFSASGFDASPSYHLLTDKQGDKKNDCIPQEHPSKRPV